MLVHICCSVDSHYFLQKLCEKYPNEKMVGFFYNPNIHPKEEYNLRLNDVKRSCDMLNIELIEGVYDTQEWQNDISGLEHEPEKGKRCVVCFDTRLKKSAQKAKELNQKQFTTTLLASPLKEQEILYKEGDEIGKIYGLEFIKINVRANGGTQEQMELAKKDNLYRQNYCGCEYALRTQRSKQNKIVLEFIDNIGNQILPGSNEHRANIFAIRDKCEKDGKTYILYKQKALIWRNLISKITQKIDNKEVLIDSHILINSIKKDIVKSGNLIWLNRNIQTLNKESKSIRMGYPKKDDSVFLTIDALNTLLDTKYKNVRELVYNPLSFNTELLLRNILCGGNSINPIIIIDKEVERSVSIFINSIFQEENIFNIAF